MLSGLTIPQAGYPGGKKARDQNAVQAMNARRISVAGGSSSVKPAEVCRMVVVYEDGMAHDRAMELAGRLASQFGGEPAFAFDSWNFKDLAQPKLTLAAVEAAARADIILFTTHGNDLPSAVVAWLEYCAGARTRADGALALLLTEPFMLSASTGAVISRLQSAARLLRMDFLSLMPAPAAKIIKSLQKRPSLPPSAFLDKFDRPNCDHWGLNE